MNFRYKFSIVLILLGLISAIMSFGGKNTSSISAEEILTILLKGDYAISPDELAGMVVEQDSGVRVVDVRNPDQYKNLSIPGAVNIPLSSLLITENEKMISISDMKIIFYSDDELLSTQAWMLAMQKGYSNIFLLRGGLNEWDNIIMNSQFEGDKITAQQNSLFEKRFKARRIFTNWNSMPDSLKAGFYEAKQKKDKELVGGCE